MIFFQMYSSIYHETFSVLNFFSFHSMVIKSYYYTIVLLIFYNMFFHICRIRLLLRAVLNIASEESKGRMCFRCLILSLSGPCGLLFLLFHWLLDLTCGECNVISLYFLCCPVMHLFVLCVAYRTEFVNCLVKQFAICLYMVVILLLNVMVLFSVGGGALLDTSCMVFQIVCVLAL